MLNGRVCRADRSGGLRWVRYDRRTLPDAGPRVSAGMPFAPVLPEGLSPRDVAITFARDWNALEACLDWGAEENNVRAYRTGPITARCNQDVWGVPNAYAAWEQGRMSDREYYRPLSVLWEKYTSYGVTLLHTWCPAGGKFFFVCEGLPYDLDGLEGGARYDHHFPYDALHLVYGGEAWVVSELVDLEDLEDVARMAAASPGDPGYLRYASESFASVPTTAEFWEFPGCRLLPGSEYRRSCTVRFAFPYLLP